MIYNDANTTYNMLNEAENILLDKNFCQKISDFGHSCINAPDLDAICGTEEYNAPEVGIRPFDGIKADVFSLGSMLMILVAGIRGFGYATKTDIYYKNAWRSPNLLPCQNLRIEAKKVLGLLKLNPKDMDPFVDRCYCKNCEPERIHKRGEEKYGLPIGWYRYGIKIREDYSENKYWRMC